MRLTIGLAALAATFAVASPAFAQSATASATGEARGVVLQPLTLAKIKDLDFGTVIASNVAGTVSIDPDTGARTTGGGVIGVPAYPGDRGYFGGAGTANQDVELTLSAPAQLVSTTNVADTIDVLSMVLDQGNLTTRTIDNSTAFFVGVGGSFDIKASQAPGLYRANFTLTADYQ